MMARDGVCGCVEATDLVDVGDEPAFSRGVDLLVVGPQFALDGEKQHLQVPFLCEPKIGAKSRSEAKTTRTQNLITMTQNTHAAFLLMKVTLCVCMCVKAKKY